MIKNKNKHTHSQLCDVLSGRGAGNNMRQCRCAASCTSAKWTPMITAHNSSLVLHFTDFHEVLYFSPGQQTQANSMHLLDYLVGWKGGWWGLYPWSGRR